MMNFHIPRRLRALVLLALCVSFFGLTACGRKGAPTPPGPNKDITYPRYYPSE
ncbi:hypothetical protein GS501_05740 [Saccharibacter sp. 17.LH.SD]|uniref:LPS translocon maturation chaperone LptM n=1 Tax=Saccharibacter sp. 17.LH.SD TaxID=2689393 RepID=UPI00139F71B3|nr:lipoprotein [Saccharibacter sp. 17.LH.SD]MXV44550.1 hypothetical protein [Saccharibacter sp. 17.LH.SD]